MRRFFLSALALGVLGAGCGDEAAPGVGDGTGAVLSRSFLAESVTENGLPRPWVEGTRIELRFHADGRLSATAGCNHIGGSVEVESDRILVGELAMTEMGCEPPYHEQDQWLAGFLGSSPGYALDADRLRLDAGDTVIQLVAREVADPDRPLEGTVWRLDALSDGDGLSSGVSSVPGQVVATLVFADGRFTVAVEGCNQGGAEVEITESALRVGSLVMTDIACEGAPAEVETAIASVLQGEVTYQVEAASLTLIHPSGEGLTFQAVE